MGWKLLHDGRGGTVFGLQVWDARKFQVSIMKITLFQCSSLRVREFMFSPKHAGSSFFVFRFSTENILLLKTAKNHSTPLKAASAATISLEEL